MNEKVEHARVQHARVRNAREDWYAVQILVNLLQSGEMPRQRVNSGGKPADAELMESDQGEEEDEEDGKDTNRAYSRLCFRPERQTLV